MEKRSLIFIGLQFIWQLSPAQVLNRSALGYRNCANAYSIYQQDAFSFRGNQASLAGLENSSAGIYNERRFLLSALNIYQFALSLITPRGNIALQGGYSGSAAYNESQMGLAYAKKLGKRAAIGIQFNYNNISMGSYGAASAITAEAGAIFHLTDQLHTGIQVSNPAGGKFGKMKEEKINTVCAIGVGYDVSRQFFTSLEIGKEEFQNVNVNVGIQYRVISQVIIRGGVSSGSSLLWMGAGFIKKAMRFDIMTGFHPRLGISPGLQLLYNFEKKNKTDEVKAKTESEEG